MKNKTIQIFILIAITLIVAGYVITLGFNNPDMTDRRLLITFWKEYLIGFIILVPVGIRLGKLLDT